MGLFGQKHRFTEKIIPLDKELYILGTAEPTKKTYDGATQSGIVKKGSNNKTFVISDKSEKEITKNWRFWLPLLLGGAGIAITSFLLISSLAIQAGPDFGFKENLGLLVFLGFAVLIFYKGFKELQKQQMMESIPTSEIQSMAMGLVELKGKAEAIGEPIKSPFTASKCVGYHCKIEKLVKGDDHSYWKTLKDFSELPEFYLKDGTGKIPVNSTGADLMISPIFEKEVRGLEKLPKTAREYLKNNKVRGLDLD